MSLNVEESYFAPIVSDVGHWYLFENAGKRILTIPSALLFFFVHSNLRLRKEHGSRLHQVSANHSRGYSTEYSKAFTLGVRKLCERCDGSDVYQECHNQESSWSRITIDVTLTI